MPSLFDSGVSGRTHRFFSLMTENFPVITITGAVKIQPDQTTVARNMVRILRKKGAQIIIAVTHIGTNVDRTIAAQVRGIDIIFGGHSHNYMSMAETVNTTLIVNGGEKGPALVRLDVRLNKKGQLLPNSAAYSLIPVTDNITENSKIKKQLSKYRNQLPAVEIIGRTEKTWILNNEVLRSRESGVADMITDMIRSQFNVDIVLYNSGAFRGYSEYEKKQNCRSPKPEGRIIIRR
jgi:5'-nucleotidase